MEFRRAAKSRFPSEELARTQTRTQAPQWLPSDETSFDSHTLWLSRVVRLIRSQFSHFFTAVSISAPLTPFADVSVYSNCTETYRID